MQRVRIDPTVFSDFTWWSWIVMIALLIVRTVNQSAAPAVAAVALCMLLAVLDLAMRHGDLKAMSVQIRLGYAVLLLIGLAPGMQWIHVVQIIGTSARVLSGYCLLHRELLLFWWNRRFPLNLVAVRDLLLAPPGPGGLLRFASNGPELENPCGLFR
jgi:hypothetical protein